LLDEVETPNPPDEAIVEFEGLDDQDVRRAAAFLQSSAKAG
jgi:hypothetical protein